MGILTLCVYIYISIRTIVIRTKRLILFIIPICIKDIYKQIQNFNERRYIHLLLISVLLQLYRNYPLNQCFSILSFQLETLVFTYTMYRNVFTFDKIAKKRYYQLKQPIKTVEMAGKICAIRDNRWLIQQRR